MNARTLLFTLVLAAGGSAFAKAPAPTVDAHKSDLAGQRAVVLKEMEAGARFAEISDDDKADVFAALDRMEKRLAGRSVDQLGEAEKVALINDQELVNALLTKASIDSRIQCRREKGEVRFGAPLQEIYGCTEAGQIAARRTVETAEWCVLGGLRLVRCLGLCGLVVIEAVAARAGGR